MRKSTDIQAKVVEVSTTEVKYKKQDNPDGPVFSVFKSEVLSIQYANGTKDTFEADVAVPREGASKPDLYMRGQVEAMQYYNGYKAASTGTLIVSLVSPIVGLIPAVAFSSARPRDRYLDYPSKEMMRQPDYYEGYSNKAKKIKQRKVWTNWGIALGVNFVAVLVLSAGN